VNIAQLQLLADTMPQILWTADADGSQNYFNRKWLDFSGLSLIDSLAHGWIKLVHPDDSQRVARHWAQALASGSASGESEYRLRRADGVYRWMLGQTVAQLDAGGQLTGWLGTLRDIDDLKQKNDLLEKKLHMLQLAGRVAHMGGWTIDLPEYTLTWSDQNCLIHDMPPGYIPTLEEGIGYFLPEHQDLVRGFVTACAEQGTPYEFVLPKMTAKGRRIWVHSIGEAVRDTNGNITRIQGAFQDITRQKNAEAHARAEHDHLHLLKTAVSRLNDMVIITEATGNAEASWRIVFVNDAFERYTGYSREEALTQTPTLLWAPNTNRAELQRIHAAMAKWQPVRAEIAILTKAGEERWVELDIAPIASEPGTFTHWVAVQRDITGRMQQQQLILKLNRELEERVQQRTGQLATVNKELESFAYSVSHDLRSPLNTIHAFSQLLVKADRDNLSTKGLHYLDRISAGVEQMGSLIDGLLTLTHLSRGQIRPENVDLSAIARQAEQHYRKRDPLRQVKVNIQDGMFAKGDTSMVTVVLQNLLGNAWKFTSRQELGQIEFGCKSGDAGEIIFFVKDNGAGFDMAFAHKLFGTFQRLHSPGDFSGIGIGLAAVKRAVELHGGRIWAKSQLNEGASFYFTLAPEVHRDFQPDVILVS
jgi:PAS domain S-box-containing protein